MKTVYVIVINDHHCDTTCEVWEDREKAIERAKVLAVKYCQFYEYYRERAIPGWEFYATYGCEDSLWVVKAEVQG